MFLFFGLLLLELPMDVFFVESGMRAPWRLDGAIDRGPEAMAAMRRATTDERARLGRAVGERA
ncbi:hypothetical protein BE08_00830 [Sorangium cellulosum]|uniref:Uncharacterized protein n=1 Tax=Sorangium cellulosum TaxID=56 RepID=A0A150PDG3_SORCE|nr:hypothetical protein BE08_00830 [Sorangium cellulosum]